MFRLSLERTDSSRLLVWTLQRGSCARQDRVDRAGADTRTKQLFDQLHPVAAADTVACREHRDSRFKARPERAACNLSGQLRPRTLPAARAAHTLSAMLHHDGRYDRQLFDLVALRLARRHALLWRELMSTVTALRPMLDNLVDRARRQQLTAVTLMAILGALLATRSVLAARLPALARRIRARGCRGVARAAIQLALQLLHPHFELLDAAIHRQQHLDYSLAPRVIDRLRLHALHTTRFDEAELCPPTPLNAYRFREGCSPGGRASSPDPRGLPSAGCSSTAPARCAAPARRSRVR